MKREITVKGDTFQLVGKEISLGKKIPECKLVNEELRDVLLSSLLGKVTLIVTVPSIDTDVCQKETKRFNTEVSLLGSHVKTLVISADLPFAQKRWCGVAGIQNLQMLSDFRHHEFGEKCGLQVKGLGLLARAILIVDPKGVLRYMQVVEELTNEPDYAKALDEIEHLLSNHAK